MLRATGTNISIITNFGCSSNCWYCIWKNHPMKNFRPDTNWKKLCSFLIEYGRNSQRNKVSVSGGGDPLFKYDRHKKWWDRLFNVCNCIDIKIDIHSRERFYDDEFLKKINRLVFSSENLEDDIDYLTWINSRKLYWGELKLRIVHVVTKSTTDSMINQFLNYQKVTGCQFSIKELSGHGDSGRYNEIKKKYPDVFCIDMGDYNIYYMPDNNIYNNFMIK